MDYRDALLKDGGKPFQNSGKSVGEIAREKQFWKRVREANKRLGLGSHPSGPSYLDLLEDAPADFQEEFLKDAPADFKERFYKIGGPRRQTDELADREFEEMIYSNISDATGASQAEARYNEYVREFIEDGHPFIVTGSRKEAKLLENKIITIDSDEEYTT